MSLFDDDQSGTKQLHQDAFLALFGTETGAADDGDKEVGTTMDDGFAGDISSEDGAAAAGGGTAGAVGDSSADAAGAGAARSTGRRVSPGALVVFLLKNYLDREDDRQLFEALIRQQHEVEEFCRRLFLRLVVDSDSGYAYVRSLSDEELPLDAGQRPPQLLTRRSLPFYDSLILILLRQRLLEFDMSGQFGRLVLERQEILTMVKTFIRKVNNDKRLDDNLNKAIDNLCGMGLLSRNKSGVNAKNKAEKELDRIEVKRIISVLVTPEILKQADEILEGYVRHIKEGGRAKNRFTAADDE